MPYGALSSGTFNGVDLSVPVNRVAVASVGDQPGRVPALQRAERDHALRLPRRVELRLDAAHAEPSDEPQLPVLRRLHVRQDARHARRRVLDRSTPTIRTAPTASLSDGSHARPERLVERVPARRRAGRHGQRVRARIAQRLADLGHLVARERHSRPARASAAPRPANSIAAAYFGTADVVGPSTQRRQRSRARLHLRPDAWRHGRRREDSRHQAASACRRSARTATSCRPTTCASRPGSNHDLTLFKNFDDQGRSEDPVPRRLLQPVQPGLRDDGRPTATTSTWCSTRPAT